MADNRGMGLTRAQKIRKHGDSAGQAAASSAAPTRPAPGRVPAPQGGTAQTRPDPEGSSSSPMLVLGAAMVISVLFLLYVNLLVLGGFASAMTEGHGVPELRLLGFTTEWFQGFAGALGDDGAEAYRSIHRSTALIAPLPMAASWALFVIVQSRGGRLFRWVGLAVVAAFAGVYLAGSEVLDRAVAAPQDTGLVSTASLLMNLRGLLLLAMIALLVWAMLRSMRRIAGEMAERGRQDRDGDGRG